MDNLRGILLMTLAMAGFAVTDAFLKALGGMLPIAQVIFLLGFGGFMIFGGALLIQGKPIFNRACLGPMVLARNGAEAVATTAYTTALSLIPLSTASAILQANPLFVTLGAALILGETVGWRRWSAIAAGFVGMLFILRPSSAGLDLGAGLAVLAMAMLALRDLLTRMIPRTLGTVQLAALAFATLIVTGLVLMPFGPPPIVPSPAQAGIAMATSLSGAIAYYAITAAMRVGDVSAVTPFRYTRLVFAMSIGILAFGERPDLMTLIGAAIIIASGLYTVFRERKRRTAAKL